jgi:hypothetical protein
MNKKANTPSGITAPLHTLKAGSAFTYGGLKWVLLDKQEDGALCLSHDVPPDERAFDTEDRNDWAASSLRAYLNGEFFKGLIKAGADPKAFLHIMLDLTSDDGWINYGRDYCKIGLLSCGEYRRFRGLIPDVLEWWWTCTPFSVEYKCSSGDVRFVYTSGVLRNNNARNGNCGVRPLCSLTPSILVSYEPSKAETENADALTEPKPEKTPEQLFHDAALDMIRHIAAAWNLTPNEIMEALKKSLTEGKTKQ